MLRGGDQGRGAGNVRMKLKAALRQHFAKQTLTDTALGELERASQGPAVPHSTRRWQLSAAVALSLLVGAAATLLFHRSTPDMAQLIAREAAKNHLEMEPLEIRGSQITSIRSYFTALDFALAEPSRWRAGPLQGGRYSSIQGIDAAHLRYQIEDGSEQTISLYELPHEAQRFGDLPEPEMGAPPVTVFDKGVVVTIWVENGLLMVSAEG